MQTLTQQTFFKETQKLHTPALAAPSFLPSPKNGSLRQAALALVQRLQAFSAKKRPLPDSPTAPSSP